MPNPDPVEQIAGLTEPLAVSKPDMVAYLKAELHCFADCAAVRNADLSGRLRLMAGSRFFRNDPSDLAADDMTETTPVIIDAGGNHWLLIEGERYDLQFGSTGLLGDGEALPASPIPIPLLLPAGLPGSFCYAVDGLPTGGAVISFKKSLDYGATWSAVFTAAFAPGARVATLALAADLSLPAGALLRPYGPNPHDATLQSLTAVVAAIR